MSTTVGETWRSVVGYEGLYEVSDHGRVRSLPRLVRCGLGGRGRRVMGGKVLKFVLCGSRREYKMVKLSRDSVMAPLNIHRAVAEAFLGPPPTPAHEVCHRDGVWNGDALANLYWGTHKDNGADMKRHRMERRI